MSRRILWRESRLCISAPDIRICAPIDNNRAFGPSLSPLLQVGYRGIVQIDAGFRAHMHRLEDYQKTCQAVTWDAMSHYAGKLKEKKTKIAFFSSTPQGGGVALMRHALVRFARTIEVDLRW